VTAIRDQGWLNLTGRTAVYGGTGCWWGSPVTFSEQGSALQRAESANRTVRPACSGLMSSSKPYNWVFCPLEQGRARITCRPTVLKCYGKRRASGNGSHDTTHASSLPRDKSEIYADQMERTNHERSITQFCGIRRREEC
jgi:hypothetical protein